MDWKEILINSYEDIHGEMKRVFKGLTKDDLGWQPKPDCNSIGWLAWHLLRVEDNQVAYLFDEEQLWIKDGWHSKFDRPADAKDVGFGNTPKQVAEFKSPDIQLFLDYSEAIFKRIKNHFLSMSAADLDQPLNQYWGKTPVKLGWRLISVLEDCFQHIGQIAYVRGLLHGKGWQKF